MCIRPAGTHDIGTHRPDPVKMEPAILRQAPIPCFTHLSTGNGRMSSEKGRRRRPLRYLAVMEPSRTSRRSFGKLAIAITALFLEGDQRTFYV